MQRAPEVFISYAHADNPARYESRDWEHRRGWVDCLMTTLTERLRQVRGRHTEIWCDRDAARLGGASHLTDTIREALQSCAVLVPVVSPSYAASAWCEAEFAFFCDARALHGGLRAAGNRLRVFKANKLPISGGSFLAAHAEVADAVGYSFYRTVEGLPLEFDPPHGGMSGDDFCRRVNAMAHDLAVVLDGRDEASAPSGKTIFLGACAPDVADQRERLRSEFRQFGHTVVPATSAERLEGTLRAAALARAQLSVHVFGSDFDASALADYEAAGDAAGRGTLVRLAWMPPDAVPSDDAQRALLERLKLDPEFAGLTVTLENFKTIVKDRLARPAAEPIDARREAAHTVPTHEAPGSAAAGARVAGAAGAPLASAAAAPFAGASSQGQAQSQDDEFKRVYLIFDPPDHDGSKALDDWLYGQGFEVVKTVAAADAAAFRKLHNGRLKSSDGVLIYHGNADDQWLEAKLDELWKVYSASRRRQPKARGVVLADPQTEYKREFRARIARVIPAFGSFDPALLEEFAHDLRRDDPG